MARQNGQCAASSGSGTARTSGSAVGRIVTEQYADGAGRMRWKAYFADDPTTVGVAGRRSDAIAALYGFCIGELIAEHPGHFGVRC